MRVLAAVALILALLFIGLSLSKFCHAGPPPPQIGKLTLPENWWQIVLEESYEQKVDPYWVVAVMAIESRFERMAINHRYKCYGLMQLQKDVCRVMGVTDPFDPRQNIAAGVKILARLEWKCKGNKLRILKTYNPTDDGSYSSEVMKAWRQARKGGN